MKVYIDLQKLAISKVVDGTSPEYAGDINSNVFEILFFNYDNTNWFPTMSQLAPNGREAGDFEADSLGVGETHDYTEDGVNYQRFTFTMGNAWVLMKGRSNLFVWYNVLNGAVLKKCVGKLNVMINESSDNYFISNPTFNPAVKSYIDDEINDKIDAQNETIASLSQASPSVFDTAANIQLLQENKGVAVATDTGYIWYWDTTITPNAYVNSNILYQATQIGDNSVTIDKLSNMIRDVIDVDNFYKQKYVKGTLNNGQYSPLNYRVVNYDFYVVEKDKSLYCSSDFRFIVVYYDADGTALRNSGWVKDIQLNAGEKIKILFARNPDNTSENITDVEGFISNFKIAYRIDKNGLEYRLGFRNVSSGNLVESYSLTRIITSLINVDNDNTTITFSNKLLETGWWITLMQFNGTALTEIKSLKQPSTPEELKATCKLTNGYQYYFVIGKSENPSISSDTLNDCVNDFPISLGSNLNNLGMYFENGWYDVVNGSLVKAGSSIRIISSLKTFDKENYKITISSNLISSGYWVSFRKYQNGTSSPITIASLSSTYGNEKTVFVSKDDNQYYFVIGKDDNSTLTYDDVELCLKNIIITINVNNDVLDFNQYKDNLILQSKSKFATAVESSNDILLFIHFSDIHRDIIQWNNIVKYLNKYNIDFALHTGDYVGDSQDQYLDLYDNGIETIKPILNCVGNHDTYENVSHTLATKQSTYNYLFNHISNWNVTFMNGDYSMSYYKDFADKHIRLIVLDCYYDIQEQSTWLASVLAEAKTLGYAVITAMHQPSANIVTPINCTFDTRNGNITAMSLFENAIKDFIANDGIYIANLSGHIHDDYIGFTANGILNVTIECATIDSYGWTSADRVQGTKSADCFNIFSIDTTKGLLKIVRIGNDCDYALHNKNVLVYNYINKEIISNY